VSDCATQPMRFETEAALALEATFDGGRITSDGGLVWLAKMDAERGYARPSPSVFQSGERARRAIRFSASSASESSR
jgi:hypothetical protein